MSIQNNSSPFNWRSGPRPSPASSEPEYECNPEGFADDEEWDGPLFQGMASDPAEVPGLLEFQARDFSPTLRRWIPQDPLAYVDGMNAYVALGGEPDRAHNPAAALPPLQVPRLEARE